MSSLPLTVPIRGETDFGRRSPEWRAWDSMITRCCRHNSARFKDYGGRGIRVHHEWTGRGGFARWLGYMGRRPSGDHSLDRVDNCGHYEPGNVKWSTRQEQMRNTRANRFLTAFGRTQCIQDWAHETGISRSTIQKRIRRGWSAERVLSEKIVRTCNCEGRLVAMSAAMFEQAIVELRAARDAAIKEVLP